MSSTANQEPGQITTFEETDFGDWKSLFQQYVAFYKSSLPEEQYQNTFDRIIRDDGDLYGLCLRHNGKLVGIAHFYDHQTPWSEGRIMHLNDLFVDPEIRGHGYGRKMIQAVANEAKRKKCFRLQWATQSGNPARKLYDELAACDFVEYRMKLE